MALRGVLCCVVVSCLDPHALSLMFSLLVRHGDMYDDHMINQASYEFCRDHRWARIANAKWAEALLYGRDPERI